MTRIRYMFTRSDEQDTYVLDAVQLTAEADRVADYGLDVTFDVKTIDLDQDKEEPCPIGCRIDKDSPGDLDPMTPHECEACGRWWVWSPEDFRWIRVFP